MEPRRHSPSGSRVVPEWVTKSANRSGTTREPLGNHSETTRPGVKKCPPRVVPEWSPSGSQAMQRFADFVNHSGTTRESLGNDSGWSRKMHPPRCPTNFVRQWGGGGHFFTPAREVPECFSNGSSGSRAVAERRHRPACPALLVAVPLTPSFLGPEPNENCCPTRQKTRKKTP